MFSIRFAYFKYQIGNIHYLISYLVPTALYQAKQQEARKTSQIQEDAKLRVFETKLNMHDNEQGNNTSYEDQKR